MEALKQEKFGHHHVETYMLCTVAEKLLYNQEPRFMPANDQLVSKVISDTMESSHTQDALDDIDMDEK